MLNERARHCRTAQDCGALIDLLDELYPLTATPSLNATDREIGAWLGKKELIDRLKTLRAEKAEELPPVLKRR